MKKMAIDAASLKATPTVFCVGWKSPAIMVVACSSVCVESSYDYFPGELCECCINYENCKNYAEES